MSSPGWLPDPFFRVFSRNVHRGKHGSDQEVYDHEGRFIPQVCAFCVSLRFWFELGIGVGALVLGGSIGVYA